MAEKSKCFKDPIYGYIEIPSAFIDIIDTSIFQRLRRIVQTSYAPLYSSAVHNRFVHSIGVYHLGHMAISSLLENSRKDYFEKIKLDKEKLIKIFEAACLLHDVGHAPFSHTGEKFFLNSNSESTELHEELACLVNSEGLTNDMAAANFKSASPHEIMSSIIGLSAFPELFQTNEEKEFFARCITGYQYSDNNTQNKFKNCFISLLNSPVIDVDKLDYLIRDAYITGFNTVSIDYIRLIQSLVIIFLEDSFEIAYKKSAISVIENVVYAHDAERKWIQNHPTVLYEHFILQNVFSFLQDSIKKEGAVLFSKAALGNEGIRFKNRQIRLLCDDDIVYLMKNVYPSEIGEQYFERKQRFHPVWKSEAEYNTLVLNELSPSGLKDFNRAMSSLVKYFNTNNRAFIANDELIENFQKELEDLKESPVDHFTKETQRKEKENVLRVLKCLSDYSKENNLKNEYVILSVKLFNSGFGKPDFKKTHTLCLMKKTKKLLCFLKQ